MAAKNSLAAAIRTVRKARGLSQEAFSDVSSRTYMSTLERDLKSPTIHKLAELCEVMEVHPLTLLTLAYAGDSTHQADELLAQVRQELGAILKSPTHRSALALGSGFPQAERAALQARRRAGLKPNGRDSVVGTGRSPKARRRFQRRHTILRLLSRLKVIQPSPHAIPALMDDASTQRLTKPCAFVLR